VYFWCWLVIVFFRVCGCGQVFICLFVYGGWVLFLSDFLMVYVTAASKVEAEKIGQVLLSERLIACVNIVGPVLSRFLWEGRVDFAEEYLLIMKTRVGLFAALEGRVRVLHSYRVPEVIAVPIVEGSVAYLAWLSEVLKP
jgi:periplasmic divalent cation tolerance protein